ncbi:hypothetical protein K7X08_029161 [Anisodus acutangulus]|uniref:Uncharacterized protein n=1 Tax=Anisodus acutangulus TaxID=402998 RepID=A0A9Q1QTW4_9SOLA|nr:hypothetical protein K7X08_029161 [Anisodus acutangulus]
MAQAQPTTTHRKPKNPRGSSAAPMPNMGRSILLLLCLCQGEIVGVKNELPTSILGCLHTSDTRWALTGPITSIQRRSS